MEERRHVVLMGLMASGKTTVGRLLAARLDRPFLDNDVMLFGRTGRTARDIAENDGADALHALEAEVLVDALRSTPRPSIVAAAAAAVFEPGVTDVLAGQFTVYLSAAAPVLAARVDARADDGHRPFVGTDTLRVLEAQAAARDSGFRAAASLVVDAVRDPSDIADEISSALAPP